MSFTFKCANVDSISLGTLCISNTGRNGSVTELLKNAKAFDMDNANGIGYIITYDNNENSYITKNDIVRYRKDFFIFE